MNHSEKVDFLVSDLKNRGLNKSWAAPFLDRFLWRIGLKTHPPLFQSFGKRFLIVFSFQLFLCAVVLGLVVLFGMFEVVLEYTSSPEILISGGLVATIPALVVANIFAKKSRKLELDPWEQYPGPTALSGEGR